MSCCWAWCLMHSRVRTWSRDGWRGGGVVQNSCPVQAGRVLNDECVCVCVRSHRHAGLAVPVFVAEVPQVDGQLAQFVVPQVPVSQQHTKEGEGQNALTPSALLLEQVRHHTPGNSHTPPEQQTNRPWKIFSGSAFVSPRLCPVPSGGPGSVRSGFHTAC